MTTVKLSPPHRPPFSAGKVDASLSSSSLSVRDVMRQRYSVTWHPRLLYLIVSDGYMATVMRVLHRPSPVTLLKMLLKDTTADLEKLSEKLCKSQVVKKQTPGEFRGGVRCWFLFLIFFIYVSVPPMSHSFSGSGQILVGLCVLS